MAATSNIGQVGFYQSAGTSTAPPSYDDGLNEARTNLDQIILALSDKLGSDVRLVKPDDLLSLSKAMVELVDARKRMDDD